VCVRRRTSGLSGLANQPLSLRVRGPRKHFMKDSVTERIERFLTGHPLFDQAVVQHGFTRHLRDYDVIVDRVASLPKSAFDAASDRHSYVEVRCRYRFTHCVAATVETKLTDETWRVS
jgi:hypothetical protein